MTGPHEILSKVVPRGKGHDWFLWHQGRKGIELDSPESYAKRDRGTRVHKLLELVHSGERPPIRSLPVFDRNHAEGLYQWLDETEPDLLHTEYRLRSERLDVNGYIDYVRRCPGCPVCEFYVAQQVLDDADARRERFGVIIGDQKHGALTSPHSHVQVGGAYRLMWQESRPEPVCGTELLGIRVDGFPQPYCVIPAVGTPKMFEHALTWYRDLAQLGLMQLDAVQEDRRPDTIGSESPREDPREDSSRP